MNVTITVAAGAMALFLVDVAVTVAVGVAVNRSQKFEARVVGVAEVAGVDTGTEVARVAMTKTMRILEVM
jgi:hypothetical protein